ncbi:cytochrome P450 [Rhodofomes roseus]|uniref:Cytochrome P450 n=1 Tax=Rhodofomes roseus TaxID=34475 RepID=A0ABQ8KN90_9APHY|nr:cytochrome P450 [Rhodofomes roseus]KAH9839883.1 cytochrome P450 [Rhodofomes roseus]
MPVIQQVTSELSNNPLLLLAVLPAAFILVRVITYFKDASGLRSYPGPFLAKFTDAWMFWVVSHNRWSSAVDEMHRKHGPFVRLAPNYVSISDPKALDAIYGHSAGLMKASFYDIFANFSVRNIFNTRSRTEHARKRRAEAHMFAPQSIRAVEPLSHVHVAEFLRQWDHLASRVQESQHGGGPLKGQLGSGAWSVENGCVWFDCMPWINFWAFDTIGDLAFGLPFGMLKSGRDTARVAKNPEEGFRAIEKITEGSGKLDIEEEDIPYVENLSTRAEINACLGWLPRAWQVILPRIPGSGFNSYSDASKKLASLSIMAVARRLANPSGRPDMLQKLLEARDDEGKPLSPVELSAEAFVLIVAGSDTIANTTCATTYYLARDQRVQAKLQAELDAALASVDSEVAPYDVVKDLPYLDAVIHEGQRLHATIGAGLPREVPAGGATILGHHLKEGTWVSVPIYHLHRAESIWGPDASEFRPERWIEASPGRKKQMMEAFVPFSIGPRACIGRSLAIMQLHIIVATLFRRYEFALKSDAPLQIRDVLARRPLECLVGMKRRKI